MRKLCAIGTLVALLVLTACGSDSSTPTTTTQPEAPKLRVVATTTQIGDWVRVLGSDQVELEVLVDPGVAVATYQPTPDDITALAGANVILRSGVGLDEWLEQALDTDGRAITRDMSRGIRIEQRAMNGTSVEDPFYWMSPINARIAVANVADALAERDSQRSAFFRTNERAYSAQLDSLRRDTERTLSSRVERKLVTARNDFGYYAREFDLVYVGAVESVPRDELVAQMRAEEVDAIVLSSVGSAADAYIVASAAGATIASSGDVLYAESLGPEGTGATTYIDAMRTNADVLVNSID